MGNLFAYSGITTKVKSLQSNLLKESDYKELASLTSVSSAVAFLKGKPAYRSIFQAIDEQTIHRGEIEQLLIHSLYSDFTKIYLFADIHQRKFLDTYFIRYEVNVLKSCLRSVFDHREGMTIDLSFFKAFFDQHSKLDITKLTSSNSIEELVNNLRGTSIYPILSNLSNIKEPKLFDYEMALDMYYFSNMWKKRSKNFKKEELEIISHSFGTKIDLLNIQWIHRCKRYYNMSSADIYAMTIPVNYKLSKASITELVECPLEQFSDQLEKTYYAKVYHPFRRHDLEVFYKSVLDRMHQRDSRHNPYSIAIINSYLYFKDKEIDKITTALECIRYGLEPKEIEHYLIDTKI